MFTLKLSNLIPSCSFLWIILFLYTGHSSAITYFTLEHASNYKIRGLEYEDARYMDEAAIYLDKMAVVNLPSHPDDYH